MAAGLYEGERNAFNRFHGKGTYKYTNGNVYEGDWVDGRKNGQGTQTWSNGEKYEGGWSNNREHGQGIRYVDSSRTGIAPTSNLTRPAPVIEPTEME